MFVEVGPLQPRNNVIYGQKNHCYLILFDKSILSTIFESIMGGLVETGGNS